MCIALPASSEMRARTLNTRATTKGAILFFIFLWELSPLSLLSQIDSETQIHQYRRRQVRQHLAKQQCQEPKKSIAFAKTHRTGSSTLQNILLRYGLTNDLTIAFPEDSWMFPLNITFDASMVNNGNWSKYLNFDLFLSHSKWSYDEVLKIVPKASFITILRDPVDCFESNFVFMGMNMDINQFAQEFAIKNIRREEDAHVGQNQLLWDLGLNVEEAEDVNTIERKLAEFDQQFDLVLIMEMYEESLVLMKDKFCWEMKDITHLRQLERVEDKKSHMTRETRAVLRKWLWADYLLYDHFLAKLKKEVKTYGKLKMEAVVTELKRCNEEISKECFIKSESENEIANMLGVKSYSADKSQRRCLAYVMAESDFALLVREYQDLKAAQLEKIVGKVMK